MEHRWGKRAFVDVPVRLRCRAGRVADGRIVNISRSGALIRTGFALARLARVDIHCDGLAAASFVTRVEDNGFGVEWCGSSLEIFTHVLRTAGGRLDLKGRTSTLRVPVAVAATHTYLTAAAVETLFGDHYRLHERSRLGQPHIYEADETVTLIGPRGHLSQVPVIGPPRPENQVQVSSTDALVLGIAPPVRRSGDIDGTPGILIRGPRATLRLERGVIRALRHVHMTPSDSERVGVQDGESLEGVIRARHSPILLRDVLVRVSPDSRLELHLDMDEANALGLCSGDEVELRKGGGSPPPSETVRRAMTR